MNFVSSMGDLFRLPFSMDEKILVPGSFVKLKNGCIVRIPFQDEGDNPFRVKHCQKVLCRVELSPFFRQQAILMEYSHQGLSKDGLSCRRFSGWDGLVTLLEIPDPPKQLVEVWEIIGYRNDTGRIIRGDSAVRTLTKIWKFFQAQTSWERAYWTDLDHFPKHERLKIHSCKSVRGEAYEPTLTNRRISIDGKVPTFRLDCEVVVEKEGHHLLLKTGTRADCIKFMKSVTDKTLTLKTSKTGEFTAQGSSFKLLVKSH
jgi:hypothetical protein